MVFCAKLNIFDNLLVLAGGNATELVKQPSLEEWCPKTSSLTNIFTMAAGILVISLLSTCIASATKSAARLIWHRLPYFEDVVPTQYFWVKIFGRRPIRQSALYYDPSIPHSTAKSTESTSQIVRTMNAERRGPTESSFVRTNKFRPALK